MFSRFQNDNFTKLLISNSHFSTTIEPSDGTIPPSSVQTFLKKYSNISTIVLANHKKQYWNRFYNSIFDNKTNVNYKYHNNTGKMPDLSIQKHLYNMAYTVSKSVYQLLTGKVWTDDSAEGQYLELVSKSDHNKLSNYSEFLIFFNPVHYK